MDDEQLRADARMEEAEARVRSINSRRLFSVNLASENPPALICEECLEEQCDCGEEDWKWSFVTKR